MRAALSIVLVVVAFLQVSAASAQPAAVGSFVRVTHDCGPPNPDGPWGRRVPCRTLGLLVTLTADSLSLGSQPLGIPRSAVVRVEVRERESRWARGLGLGALVGAALGVAAGIYGDQASPGDMGSAMWLTVPAGVVVGSLVGVFAKGGAVWREAPLDAAGVDRRE
jgi:hypothetical protein